MGKYKITVFTPAYDRAYIIENLYKSLQKQSFENFQWVVVNDGSKDNTEDLINGFIKENNFFDIVYKKVENGGKHRAINKGLEIAEGELFFIVDSDDYLTDNSLERIVYWESTIEDKEKFAGVSGNRGYSENEIIGAAFEGEYVDGTALEREKNNLLGDKAEVFYTDILRKNKFPEIEGEKFITERIVWDELGYQGFKLRWFNEIIYICNYLEDGLTNSVRNLFINNPKGYALDIKTQIKFRNIKGKDKWAIWVSYYDMVKEKKSLNEMAENLEINQFSLIFLVILWRIKDLIKGRKA